MTTIITNGKWLLADKRASHQAPSEASRYDDPDGRKFYRDDVRKIRLPEEKLRPIYKLGDNKDKRRIVAYAIAGSTRTGPASADNLLKALAGLNAFLNHINSGAVQVGTFNMLGILDDGSIFQTYSSISSTTVVKKVEIKTPGKCYMIGTGTMDHEIMARLEKMPGVSMLDIFLYSTYHDTSSSCDYSAYNFEKNQYIAKITPSDAQIKKSVDLIQSKVGYYGTKRRFSDKHDCGAL